MTEFEALKQMPLNNFADIVFCALKEEDRTLEEFIDFLKEEIPEHLEVTLKKALHELQCLNEN
ncbi:MAG: hypothetical protein NC123_17050 [Butyrivibrio sp.]|nr:hypothetical protein [Acetatifactor muris]MCM1561227.1 hypothetical protein [Butyrivibrio sp.]